MDRIKLLDDEEQNYYLQISDQESIQKNTETTEFKLQNKNQYYKNVILGLASCLGTSLLYSPANHFGKITAQFLFNVSLNSKTATGTGVMFGLGSVLGCTVLGYNSYKRLFTIDDKNRYGIIFIKILFVMAGVVTSIPTMIDNYQLNSNRSALLNIITTILPGIFMGGMYGDAIESTTYSFINWVKWVKQDIEYILNNKREDFKYWLLALNDKELISEFNIALAVADIKDRNEVVLVNDLKNYLNTFELDQKISVINTMINRKFPQKDPYKEKFIISSSLFLGILFGSVSAVASYWEVANAFPKKTDLGLVITGSFLPIALRVPLFSRSSFTVCKKSLSVIVNKESQNISVLLNKIFILFCSVFTIGAYCDIAHNGMTESSLMNSKIFSDFIYPLIMTIVILTMLLVSTDTFTIMQKNVYNFFASKKKSTDRMEVDSLFNASLNNKSIIFK